MEHQSGYQYGHHRGYQKVLCQIGGLDAVLHMIEYHESSIQRRQEQSGSPGIADVFQIDAERKSRGYASW